MRDGWEGEVHLVEPESLYVQVGKLQLHCVEWGEAGLPPLICLHGYSSHSRIWDRFAESARREYRVIGMDQRGHGRSGWATDGYARDAFVKDLDKLCGTLGLDRVTLVGLSMGGWHSLLYASEHPEMVDRVVLVDIAPEVSPRSARRSEDAEEPTPNSFESLEEAFAFARRRNPRPPEDLLLTDISNSLRQCEDGKWTWRPDPAMLKAGFDDPRNPDMIHRYWQALEAVVCPLLVVRGAESGLVSDEVVARMEAANPNVSAVEVPNSGHNVPLDSPEGFLEAVRGFLEID